MGDWTRMRRTQLQLGIGAVAAALLLALVAIPAFVSSPSNVRTLVLAPTFWPYVLAGLTGIAGLALLASGWRMAEAGPPHDEEARGAAPWLRLAAMAAIMALTMLLIPWLGMVWTSMLAFAASALLFRTRHPVAALICAVAVPLALYAFFAHVAGVAIPQGELVRLP